MSHDATSGAARPRTLGELRAAGITVRPVREEMRRNLLARLSHREPLLPGIIGFDETVIPEIENALLAGHHMVFLGERGQAKSRIIRGLTALLDEAIPAIEGCPLHDDPYSPICKACRTRVAEEGDAVPIAWIGRDARYGEKLATPDTSVADLIGEVDPIKVAEGRYLADEETIHYGLVPRSNRGPLRHQRAARPDGEGQVGLFNLMEEKDVQIKGYKIRLPLDVVIVASANPEDYTSRGRIITPLKDRFDVQIRTHYPRTVAHEIAIMEQELPPIDRGNRAVHVPDFVKQILAQVTFEARASTEINQASGVSRAGDDQQLRERAEQRREARRAQRRVRDRAAPQRSAGAARVDGRQDRDRVRRRGAERVRRHRASGESRHPRGLRRAVEAGRPGAGHRPLRGGVGRRGSATRCPRRTTSRASRRFPASAKPSTASAPTRAPGSLPPPAS
jgi:magnesium chelatase subunit I